MNKSDLRNIIKEEISRVIADGLLDNNFKFNKIYEVMVPSHRDDYYEIGETNYMVIAQDDVTDDKLVLFTELHKTGDYYVYSYFFDVFDRKGNKKTRRMYTRDKAAKYLPKEIKPTITLSVLKMTKSLINRIKPDIIQRETAEYISEEHMDRYDIISKLLQDDLGYKLIDHKVDADGHRWIFSKNGENIDLDENTILDHFHKRPSVYDEILVRAEANLLNEIKKNPLKLD
jgi:hypothetical protein